MVRVGQRAFMLLVGLGVALGLSGCFGKSSADDPREAETTPTAPSTTGPGVVRGRWALYTLPTATDSGGAAVAFAGERSAVVLGGGRLAELRVGVGLQDHGAAPADVIDGPVAAGPGRVALLVMRRASGGRGQLAVVLVNTDGSQSAVLPVATVAGPRAVDHALLGSSSAGELTVVWHELLDRERVFLASASPGGPFGPRVVVAPGLYDASLPDLALGVGPAGHLAVVTNGRRGLIARVRPPDGSLGPPGSVGPTYGQDDIDVDVDADGNVLVAWSTTTPGEEAEEGRQNFNNRIAVFAARRDARDGRFGSARRLLASDPESDEGLPDVAAAFDAAGGATVVFAAMDAGRRREPLLAFTARPGGRFDTRQRLAAATDPGARVDLAASSDGRMAVATRGNSRVRAALRAPRARRFGRLKPLARLRSVEEPVIAFAPDGRAAVVAWLGSTRVRRERRPAITVAVRR